jgi:hypothetical protein
MDTAAEPTEALPVPLPFDITRAFTFFFEDADWIPKLAVGTLFVFLSPFLIGAILVTGYAVSLARRVGIGFDFRVGRLQEIFRGLRGMAVTLAPRPSCFSILCSSRSPAALVRRRSSCSWDSRARRIRRGFRAGLSILVISRRRWSASADRPRGGFRRSGNVDFIRPI